MLPRIADASVHLETGGAARTDLGVTLALVRCATWSVAPGSRPEPRRHTSSRRGLTRRRRARRVGAGRAPGAAVGIGSGRVPADQLRSWPGSEPSCERVRGPCGQDVERPAGLDVDQQRPVAVPLAQRTRPRPAPAATCSPPGRAGCGPAAAASSGSPRPLTGRTGGPRPGRPMPGRRPPAPRSPPGCATCLAVSALTCSTNVFFAQSADRQRNRRTCRQIITSQPPTSVSSNRRS